MKIMGLQKLTLLDYPGRMAATIFTYGCDYCCPFCHNRDLVLGDEKELINEDEIISFLKKRVGILEGVCITGGEPLLQADIIPFIEKIKKLGFLVKLDTNGSFPTKLKEIVNGNLVDYVAMDIKNSEEKYGLTVGLEKINLDLVKESIEFLKTNKVSYEFRTTVVKEYHTKEDFIEISKMIKGASAYYLQGFVDSGNLICENLHGYSKDEMMEFVNLLKEYIPNTQLRGL